MDWVGSCERGVEEEVEVSMAETVIGSSSNTTTPGVNRVTHGILNQLFTSIQPPPSPPPQTFPPLPSDNTYNSDVPPPRLAHVPTAIQSAVHRSVLGGCCANFGVGDFR